MIYVLGHIVLGLPWNVEGWSRWWDALGIAADVMFLYGLYNLAVAFL